MKVSGGSSPGGGSSASAEVVPESDSRLPLPDVYDATLIDEARALIKKTRAEWAKETEGWTAYQWTAYYVPALGWLRTYQWRTWLVWDLVAGMSTAAMVIPQGMSYANLAGLPYAYGLYGAFVPCIVYALFGSSRQLVVGPVAVTSIILGSGLENIFGSNDDPNNPADPDLQMRVNHGAVQVAFIAGCLYTAVGVFRMGWITYFLSSATISGFMSGASVIIAMSQVKYILGLKLPRSDTLQGNLEAIFDNIAKFQWREFCMGMAFIFLLLSFTYLSRTYKRLHFLKALGPLSVCIISIALMNIFDWYVPVLPPGKTNPADAKPLIKPIGKIPKGLPDFTAAWWLPLYDVGAQILLAVIICLIDICESIAIAKALARVNKYQLNYTQELRGLGIANIAGAMFNCYTTTGSFSRSAVNNSVGAKTPLANFSTGITILITLLWITPVFTNMSQNVQGAIIIVGVLQLFDWPEFLYLWKINKLDWLVWVASCITVLFAGVEIGIAVGVGLSLVLVIWKTAFPRISQLGRLPGTSVYRSVAMYPESEATPGVLLLRIDAPIWFANVESVKDYVRKSVADQRAVGDKTGEPVRVVVLDLAPVTDIDATGIHFLDDFVDELQEDGVKLVLGNPSQQVLLSLKRANLDHKIGASNIFVHMADAVARAQAVAQAVQKVEAADQV
ncbi:sulfate transporter [Micractinium conductrix]|uniref:Sulfate transporter n=1 Tax=Micractinium conductrix TaxID=554055 RepID=A0A2P6V4J7_9CHLO|nr:sulfate transporter [Micractinium conductrix]|eukprot:PSC69015.1 sulfate transporter [Micractinium conductrix]